VHAKLKTELTSARLDPKATPSWIEFEGLPYLSAVIKFRTPCLVCFLYRGHTSNCKTCLGSDIWACHGKGGIPRAGYIRLMKWVPPLMLCLFLRYMAFYLAQRIFSRPAYFSPKCTVGRLTSRVRNIKPPPSSVEDHRKVQRLSHFSQYPYQPEPNARSRQSHQSPNHRIFEPERWLQPDSRKPEKYFLTPEKGPRACLGMNVAYAELYRHWLRASWGLNSSSLRRGGTMWMPSMTS